LPECRGAAPSIIQNSAQAKHLVESDYETERFIDPEEEKILLVAMLISLEASFWAAPASRVHCFLSHTVALHYPLCRGVSPAVLAGHPGPGWGVWSLAGESLILFAAKHAAKINRSFYCT
jgi:hypothetical protein